MYRYFLILFFVFIPCLAFSVQAENPEFNSAPSQLNKEVSLKKLLEQFSYEDWRDWDHAFLISKGTPTLAKYYIERVSQIDRELSIYLNASAHFLHLLYLRTRAGEIFDFDSELDKAREKFDGKIIDDLKNDGVFSSFLENLRYEFTLKYLEQNPSSNNNPRLLVLLDRTKIDSRLYPRLIENIDRLSLKASSLYRKSFFENQDLVLGIRKLVDKDLAAKRSLANLFLLGVVDALERGEKAWAEHLFQQSKEVYPNFALQMEVAKFLQKPESEESPLLTQNEDKDKKFKLFQVRTEKKEQSQSVSPQSSSKTTKASSISLFFVFILLLFFGITLVVLVLYKRYAEQQRYKRNIRSAAAVGEDAKNLETIPGLDEFSARKVANS